MPADNLRVIRELFENVGNAVASSDVSRVRELVSTAQTLPDRTKSHNLLFGSLLYRMMPGLGRFTRMVEDRPLDVHVVNHAFSIAIKNRNAQVAQQLVEIGLSPTDDMKWLAIAQAVDERSEEQLAFVLETIDVDVNGANFLDAPISHLDTPAQLGDLGMVRALLRAGCIASPCSVLEAARNGRVEVLQLLLESGGDPTAHCLRVGSSASRYMARHRHSRNRDAILAVLNKHTG